MDEELLAALEYAIWAIEEKLKERDPKPDWESVADVYLGTLKAFKIKVADYLAR